VNKERVETFSDGVFAIAITLLILTIAQPTDYGVLARQLAERWPSLAAYVVSFLVIGIMWLNHHTIFSHLARIDRASFYCNFLLLMTIVFIPIRPGYSAKHCVADTGPEPRPSSTARSWRSTLVPG
jgi:uncharacterized membrane protein